MREKTVKRFYCDHCSRGGFRKKDMAKHEERCIYNPLRKCFLCEDRHEETPPMPDLLAAIEASLDKLRDAAQGCPACMLAAIVQSKGEIRKEDGPDPDLMRWVEFNYKQELEDYHAERNEMPGFNY